METIRCCIACILPCGALDVVRIVHSNGRVEEISEPVLAGEIMKAYPKHVLRKPPSTCPADGGGGIVVQKPVILPPNAELQKGKIYFLMPVMTPAPEKAAGKPKTPAPAPVPAQAARRRRRRKESSGGEAPGRSKTPASSASQSQSAEGEKERLLANERYLSEIMKEKASTARDRRRGRVAVWRPHLESITEDDL
ncbi:splicing factor, arginine/serine-rich 19-like [Lolium rigidum]|uniref:splicing factor, arginine/serine-rich 19-like n=1 Tax=Lolium rigidum TaxID=89674 RepID=UPI001F5DA4B3|nr:splicing factor, arginine/serine-rich 19-like [Lolium rigidum]